MAATISLGASDSVGNGGVNGKVGIGVTTPSQPLHVRGGMLVDDDSPAGWTSGAVAKIDLGDSYSSLSNTWGGNMALQSNNAILIQSTASTGPITLGVNGSTNQLYLKNGGNVGIATTNPTEKFEVAGKIKANNNGAAPFNLAILTSDPPSPSDGDIWVSIIGGVLQLNIRVSGLTKRVTLT